ncbi:MAG: IPTL-CTERM sorting domain-containing protein, partial [Casimicrobium sp.]
VTKTTATVTEGNVATDTLTVTCTGAFTGGLTSGSVQYAITNLTNPGDIAAPALTGALNFPACGGATQSITISPRVNDSVVQGNKSGTFTISTAVAGTLGTPTTGTINVNDDDTPQTVTVAVGGSPATEAGGVLTYTFTRAGGNAAALAAPLTVNVTPPTTSARYSTTCAPTITFAGASPTASCTVTGINNAVADGNVNVVVAVAAPTVAGSYLVGTPSSATGVIADDEITVTVTPTGVIEGGVVTFAIACTGPAGASVTGLNFAVTPAQDAGAAPATPGMSGAVGTLTCGTPFVVSVPTFNDVIIGNTRSLTLTLSGTAVGSNNASVTVPTAAAVATVIDNDVPLIVPTMGAWGLGLMSLMLAGLVGFQRRRPSK